MNVHYAKEGELAWLEGVSLDDLPEELPAGIQILSREGKLGLRCDGLVGAISLKSGATLRILPKIGDINFFNLLFRAEGSLEKLAKEFDGFATYAVSEHRNLDSLVANSLFMSADEILRRSPLFGRVQRVASSNSALGAILPVPTLRNMRMAKDKPVISKTKSRDFDVAENRVIALALEKAAAYLDSEEMQSLGEVLQKWRRRFSMPTDAERDIAVVETSFARGHYGGSRGYYQRALMLSLIMLGASGLSAQGSQAVQGRSILMNTADVFEKYLRNVMRGHYTSKGYIVAKGGIEGVSLYSSGLFALEPDITVYRDGKLVLLCDAKYKAPSASDHYQMHAYLNGFGMDSGLLLCPGFDSTSVQKLEYMTPDRKVVREVYLPMANLNFTEEYLGSLVREFALH